MSREELTIVISETKPVYITRTYKIPVKSIFDYMIDNTWLDDREIDEVDACDFTDILLNYIAENSDVKQIDYDEEYGDIDNTDVNTVEKNLEEFKSIIKTTINKHYKPNVEKIKKIIDKNNSCISNYELKELIKFANYIVSKEDDK